MTLTDWLRYGWLTEHRASASEIRDLLAAADRDLSDCRAAGLSADWRLSIAHNAAQLCATAALAASGFRVARDGHHYRTIQSLALTVGLAPETVNELDGFRKKRNLSDYQRSGAVSDREANEMVSLAIQLREVVATWLRANHPGLVAEDHASRESRPSV